MRGLAGIVIAGALGHGAGAAELYETVSPNQMLALLETQKGQFQLTTHDLDTTLEGRIDGVSYSVFFYDCDGGGFTAPAKPDSACKSLEYRAYFADHPSDPETVNAWNAEYHYGKLWRDRDGDLAVNLPLVVEGGVSGDNLRTSYKWWRSVLEGVDEFMRTRPEVEDESE